MKFYSKAPDECTDRVAHLIKVFHPDIEKAALKVDLISVTTDKEDSDALTLHGYPCQAVVRIVGTKDRTMGRGDAEIVIDEENYLGLSEAEKDALLDHELYHILIQMDGAAVKLDQHGRPKLKMRKHDREYGWFDEIAKRHGAASAEVMQFTRLVLAVKQTYFDFTEKLPAGLPVALKG